jgi:hypothetical protein
VSLLTNLARRLCGLFRGGREDAETREELQFHLEMEAEKNLRAGMDAREARRRAHVRLGGVDAIREAARDARGGRGACGPATPEVRPAHKSACLVARRGTRSSLTIASRADIVGRIRPHGAAGSGESARGQSLIRPVRAGGVRHAAGGVPGSQEGKMIWSAPIRRRHFAQATPSVRGSTPAASTPCS